MARILFAWELGGGMGHVAPYLPLLKGLRRLGHDVAFAMRNLRHAETTLGACGIPYFQAPVILGKPRDEIHEPHTFAQILHNVGYGDVELLTSLARGWQQLYRCYRPDLIVFDHSPTALIAARGFSVRTLVTGTGFFIPPDAAQPLVLRRDPPPVQDRIAHDEARVLSNINQVLARIECAPVERIPQIYRADAQVMLTFRELDHFRERQQDQSMEYWGVAPSGLGSPPHWPAGEGQKLFGYLKPFDTLPSLLEALQRLGNPALIYAPEVDAQLKQRFGTTTIHFPETPLNLAQTLAECDVAITNATHATAAAVLLAGKPQLLLPLFLEQRLVAENVERLGAGLNAPALHPQGMAAKLQALLADSRYRSAAAEFARRHAGFDPLALEQRLIGRIVELLK